MHLYPWNLQSGEKAIPVSLSLSHTRNRNVKRYLFGFLKVSRVDSVSLDLGEVFTPRGIVFGCNDIFYLLLAEEKHLHVFVSLLSG